MPNPVRTISAIPHVGPQKKPPGVCTKTKGVWRWVYPDDTPPGPDPTTGFYALWYYYGPTIPFPPQSNDWTKPFNWSYLASLSHVGAFTPVPPWTTPPTGNLSNGSIYQYPVY